MGSFDYSDDYSSFDNLLDRTTLLTEGGKGLGGYHPSFGSLRTNIEDVGGIGTYRARQFVVSLLYRYIKPSIINEEELDYIESQGGAASKGYNAALTEVLDKHKDEIAQRADEIGNAMEENFPEMANKILGVNPEKAQGKIAARAAQKLANDATEDAQQGEDITDNVEDALDNVLVQVAINNVLTNIQTGLGEPGFDISEDALQQVIDYVDKIETVDQLEQFVKQITPLPDYQKIAFYLSSIIKPLRRGGMNAPESEEEGPYEVNEPGGPGGTYAENETGQNINQIEDEEEYFSVYKESATSLDNTFAIDSAVSPWEELFRGSWDEIVEWLGPEYEHELLIRKGELGDNKFQVFKGDGIQLDEFKSGRQTEKRDEDGRLIPRFKYFVKRAEPLDPADDHSSVEAYRKARGIEMPSDEEVISRESLNNNMRKRKLLFEKKKKWGKFRSNRKQKLVVEKDLDAAERRALPDSDFALPGKGKGPEGKQAGSYPIPDESHARSALSLVSQHGTPEEKKKVRAAVARKYPDIKQEDEEARADLQQGPMLDSYQSNTSGYLSEQVAKDRRNTNSKTKNQSFKERFKPKTHWQLQELRRMGL